MARAAKENLSAAKAACDEAVAIMALPSGCSIAPAHAIGQMLVVIQAVWNITMHWAMGLTFSVLTMLPRLSATIPKASSTSAQILAFAAALAPALAAGPAAAADATAAALPGKDSQTVTANNPATVAAAPNPTGRRRCRQDKKRR